MRTLVSILTAMVVLAVGSVGAAAPSAAPAGGGLAASDSGSAVRSAQAAGLTRAGQKALKKCQKIHKLHRRKACIRRVRKTHAKPKPAPVVEGTTYDIEVRDKYFNPAYIEIKKGDSLLWTWPYVNKDAHNVDLVIAPAGVERLNFSTPNSPSVGFTFKRTFEVAGTYNFICSIHHLMGMQVEVTK